MVPDLDKEVFALTDKSVSQMLTGRAVKAVPPG
jgi:hypothetical protein